MTGSLSLSTSSLALAAALDLSTTALVLFAVLAGLAALLLAFRTRKGAPLAAPSVPAPGMAPERSEQLEHARLGGADHGLPHAEERFRTPLDQLENYAIILLDTQGRPTSWNTGIHRVLGYERAEFLRTTAADLYPAEARESGMPGAHLAEASRVGRFTVECWLVRKDGSLFWGSLATTAVHDRDGRLLGFARRLRDLTEHKQSEERLRRKQDALELALEAAGLGTWEYDLSTGAEFLDTRARALFGIAADEDQLGAHWVDALHPDDRDRVIESWHRAVRESSRYTAEYRVVWPDGSIHWVMSVGRCLTDPATGSAVHFTGVVLDLTERRRAEERLQESLRLEAVGRLAGGIAHDLNNMLAAILGFGDLLSRSFEPNDPRAHDVEQISRAATRSASLTRQLLAFARRELIQPHALDLNTVIRHTQPLLAPILGENVELELRLAPDLGAVYADPRQIEQTVMNLVLNARDAMPQGGGVVIETRTVHLGPAPVGWEEDDVAPQGRFSMLSVTDTGHGMDAATLQRIWEPFFTTKPPGRGTGLGLAAVYGAAKQCGGFVWADSEPGRGTTVQVYWPEIREPVADSDAEAERHPPLVGGSESILVVEDEDLVRSLSVRALRSFGYVCHQAPNAGEALRLLERGTAVDLVITDVVMPGMSGGHLGERIQQLRPKLPVLYTSAFTDEEVIRRGLLAEGRPFLQKPFTPADLARAVREALDAAALRPASPSEAAPGANGRRGAT